MTSAERHLTLVESRPLGDEDEDFNSLMARQFRTAADLLESQGADGFRIRAYRRAADVLAGLPQPVSQIYREHGRPGLIALPAIGEAMAQAIADTVDFGAWRWFERLHGSVEPVDILTTVAGIGSGLAERIHDRLGIESLEELELAAHDGRLAAVEGFGPKRVQSVVDSLAGRLRRDSQVGGTPWWLATTEPASKPTIDLPTEEELLDVDREYREMAEAGELPLIAPRRFNPEGEAWLPVLHTTRGPRHFTAMFSNTARAHQLGRTRDWVVIYADGSSGGQWTAVDDKNRPRDSKRTIRGRTSRG